MRRLALRCTIETGGGDPHRRRTNAGLADAAGRGRGERSPSPNSALAMMGETYDVIVVGGGTGRYFAGVAGGGEAYCSKSASGHEPGSNITRRPWGRRPGGALLDCLERLHR